MKKKGNGVRKWGILTAISAILLVAVIVGSSIAFRYTTTINVALGTSTFKIIKGDSDTDTEYFKSDFKSEDERIAYEEELCATIEAEGAALLKNENQALPLSNGAKVSLFGFGSANLMYGGTGSGAVDTKSAPTLKDALADIMVLRSIVHYGIFILQRKPQKNGEEKHRKLFRIRLKQTRSMQ